MNIFFKQMLMACQKKRKDERNDLDPGLIPPLTQEAKHNVMFRISKIGICFQTAITKLVILGHADSGPEFVFSERI